jgi:hypothetical protein
MSESTLRRVLERLNTDAEFREQLQRDPGSVLGELELSPAELSALGSQDEDALRRLAGAEVTAFMGPGPAGGGVRGGGGAQFYDTEVVCTLFCWWTIDTPGSGRGGCGPSTGTYECRI